MSSEVALWRYLSTGMRGRWHAQRHEDKYTAGIPDVSFAVKGTDGWIELKAVPRAGTTVNVGLSYEQAIWLRRRGAEGNGCCFVLARVGREHLLFRHSVVVVLTCPQPMDGLRVAAEAIWPGPINFNQFAAMIARRG